MRVKFRFRFWVLQTTCQSSIWNHIRHCTNTTPPREIIFETKSCCDIFSWNLLLLGSEGEAFKIVYRSTEEAAKEMYRITILSKNLINRLNYQEDSIVFDDWDYIIFCIYTKYVCRNLHIYYKVDQFWRLKKFEIPYM